MIPNETMHVGCRRKLANIPAADVRALAKSWSDNDGSSQVRNSMRQFTVLPWPWLHCESGRTNDVPVRERKDYGGHTDRFVDQRSGCVRTIREVVQGIAADHQ